MNPLASAKTLLVSSRPDCEAIRDAFLPRSLAERLTDWGKGIWRPKPHPLVSLGRAARGQLPTRMPTIRAPLALPGKKTLLVVTTSVVVITATGIVVWWWFATRNHKFVDVVDADNSPKLLVADLKAAWGTEFQRIGSEYPKRKTPGGHGQLAFIRRECEELVVTAFTGMGLRFRDVGGSRLRNQAARGLKHLCIPQLTASDVLRDAKTPKPKFDHCRKIGSKCPAKATFPGALLTYVDFYMSADELSSIVRSHTFIITHNFEGDKGNFLGEADWKVGPTGQVEMSTTGGTTYCHHRHLWKTEGHVVGAHGAFTYERIAEVGGSLIIYAFPSVGKYDRLDTNRLKSTVADKMAVGNGAEVYRAGGAVHYLGAENGDGEREHCQLPASVLDMAVGKFANVPNDTKRVQAMTQFVRSKIEATNGDQVAAHAVDSMCRTMNRRHVLLCGAHLDYDYDAANRSVLARGRLVAHNWFLGKVGRWGSGLSAPTWLQGRGRLARAITPWAFKTVTVNTYVSSVRLNRGQLVEAFKRPKMPFRDTGTGADAATDNGQRGRASPVPGEHGGQHRDSRVGGLSGDAPAAGPSTNEEWSSAHSSVGRGGPPSEPRTNGGISAGAESEGSDVDVPPCNLLVDPDAGGPARKLVVAQGADSITVYHADLPGALRISTAQPAALGQYLLSWARTGVRVTEPAVWTAKHVFDANNTCPHPVDQEAKPEGQPTQGARKRVSAHSSDGVVAARMGTVAVRGLGNKVPHSAPGSVEGRQGRSGKGRFGKTKCHRQELPQAGDLAQDGRSKKHQPKDGRVPMRRRTVHRRDREGGAQGEVPGKGAKPSKPSQ